MENYIFNCYLKWLKDEKKKEGNIFKRISKLTITANVLIASMIIVLAAIIVLFVLEYYGLIAIDWIYLPLFLESIIGAITYVYTSRYEIDHSYDNLSEYKAFCQKLSIMLSSKQISNPSFLSDIIERIDTRIENMNSRIKMIYDRVHKIMELLIIPIALSVIGSILDNQPDTQMVLDNIISIMMTILLIYAILGGGCCFVINLTIAKKKEKYMLFKCDLQSILDFDICHKSIIQLEE